MIPAIDPGVGLKEERPATNPPELVTGGEQYTEVGLNPDILHMANFLKIEWAYL